ncbi:MAG TPA: helix-turn-helix domain-containing protein [Polyangiaceae bacterium]|nr:helix-turn-helix domain-containing protein [Polyangiaceae bacterium]
MGERRAKTSDAAAQKEMLVRQMLERIGDKWTLLVIEELGSGGEQRFTELRHRIGNVSQKMLTKTLRDLERDGLVTRRVHPVVPPRVDYKLTKLGEALGEAVCGMWTWVEKHMKDVERARRAYDVKAKSGQVPE